MRIIAGSARGTKIEAPEGMETRPVTDKIRQSLFNIWQFEIQGADFLDVFSGSGSMGLEALSRGANEAVMIEKSRKAADVIRRNLEKTHLKSDHAIVMEMDAFAALEQLSAKHKTFDFIYLDPPYTVDEIFLPIMEALAKARLLKKEGVVVIRTRKEKQMPEQFGALKKFRQKDYGISRAHFYALEEENS